MRGEGKGSGGGRAIGGRREGRGQESACVLRRNGG